MQLILISMNYKFIIVIAFVFSIFLPLHVSAGTTSDWIVKSDNPSSRYMKYCGRLYERATIESKTRADGKVVEKLKCVRKYIKNPDNPSQLIEWTPCYNYRPGDFSIGAYDNDDATMSQRDFTNKYYGISGYSRDSQSQLINLNGSFILNGKIDVRVVCRAACDPATNTFWATQQKRVRGVKYYNLTFQKLAANGCMNSL